MDGAHHGPFAPDLIETAQPELSEASRLFDLSQDGLDHLVAETVATASTGTVEGFRHFAHQRPSEGILLRNR